MTVCSRRLTAILAYVHSFVLILSDLKMQRIYLCILGVLLRMHSELIFSYIT